MGTRYVGESECCACYLYTICSVVAALASVLGDLTEVCLARQGIKDSGHLIPGHGSG